MLSAAMCVGAVVLCWILGSPAGAGPDEPSHLVRSAALIRANTDGVLSGTMSAGPVLPTWIGVPDPSCYALQPYQPASCAAGVSAPAGVVAFVTTATAYPIWGHLTYGPGTLMPAAVGWWTSRVSGAVLPVVLVAWALTIARQRTGRLGASGVLLALTPMAWFSMAVVNPSALVIAGGVAMGVGLLRLRDQPGTAWLAACGWAAMVLPRRDGLVWACAMLVLVVVFSDRIQTRSLRTLTRVQLVVVCGSTVAAMAYGLLSRAEASSTVIIPPIATAAFLGIWSQRHRWNLARARTTAGIVGVVVIGLGMLWWFIDRQADGRFGSTLFVRMVSGTGENLTEAIGVLGWLDTPVPTSFVLLWTLGLGVLCAVSLVVDDRRDLAMAGSAVVVAVVASYVIEASQGVENNWQGRYYLPLLVLAPIVLGGIELSADLAIRFARVVAVVSVVVLNASYVAALRRWAVGLDGTFNPLRWDTYDSPLPPLVLICAHLVATWFLLSWAVGEVPSVVADSVTAPPDAESSRDRG